MIIYVDVIGQKLKIVSNTKNLVSGSQNFIRFFFNLDSDWDGLTVFAQFQQNGNTYNVYLNENNCVYLPAEITKGECYLTLYGTGGETKATTNYLILTIDENILVTNAQSVAISLTLYEQLVNRISALIASPAGVGGDAGLESLIATQEEFLSLFDRSYDVASSGGETGGDSLVVITAPSAPANVTATAGDSSIAISWSAVADAEYYAVERTTDGGSTWTTVASNITGTNYTDSTAVAGTSYRYAVAAYKTFGSGVLSSGRGALSEAVSIQQAPVAETPPAAPANVTALWNASEGKVYVSWTAASGVSCTLERKADSGAWESLSLTSANSYTDSSVTAGTTYQYRVTAHKGSLSSDPATVSVTVPNSGGEPGEQLTPAQTVVKNITVGWNLANSLDATYSTVQDDVLGTANEGIEYEKRWGNPATTATILSAVRNKGFNALRLPVTWNHHLIDDGNGNVTISSYFLARVKAVVDMALTAGFQYVIVNSHHDVSDYSKGKASDYALTSTGLTWETAIPYQLFYTDDSLTEAQVTTMCNHMRNLWTQIATAFTNYDNRLIFEGFNEILGTNRQDWSYPSNAQIAQTNRLNNAFIAGVRAAGGSYNPTRVLTCQHYGGQDWLSDQNGGRVVAGFNVTDPAGTGYIILQIHSYWNSPATIAAGARQNLAAYNNAYPVIIGEVGWNRGASSAALNGVADAQIYYGSGDNKTYLLASDFCEQMARLVAAEGAKVFWWDNNRYSYNSAVELLGLLNRSDTNAQGTAVWYRETAADKLVAGATASGNSGGSQLTETAPAAPASITADAANGSITVSWSLSSGAEYYTLERKAGSGAWSAIAQNYTGRSYTDSSVTAGTTYQYRVTAHKTGTSGVLSSNPTTSGTVTAQAGTPSGNVTLDAPASVTATAGSGSIAVTWGAVSGASRYQLERSADNGATWTTLLLYQTANSYTDTTVAPETSYKYRVTAFSSSGDTSPAALSSSATPQAAPAAVIGGNAILSSETAATVVGNITVGWNLGNTLDCCNDPVQLRTGQANRAFGAGIRSIGSENEGKAYETSWGDTPITTQEMLEAVVDAGFNSIRIPVTWNHHLRDAALPYDWGVDVIDSGRYTTDIPQYPNLSGTVIISPFFLKRVKEVVNMALNAGFRYVILDTHHDTADYNSASSRTLSYAKNVTGLPWLTDIPYQLFHCSNRLGYRLENVDGMTAEKDFQNMCDYMYQLWTMIATEFKDYDYRLIFEGFNEMLNWARAWDQTYHAGNNNEVTTTQHQRFNAFNNTFIKAVRNAGGAYNPTRVLSCETFGAVTTDFIVNGFNLSNVPESFKSTNYCLTGNEISAENNRIILQAHYYNDVPNNFQTAAESVASAGLPVIFGEVGWHINSGAPSDLYNFGYNLVQKAKSTGAKVFWWDNNKTGTGKDCYGMLNRWDTKDGTVAWDKETLKNGLIAGANAT